MSHDWGMLVFIAVIGAVFIFAITVAWRKARIGTAASKSASAHGASTKQGLSQGSKIALLSSVLAAVVALTSTILSNWDTLQGLLDDDQPSYSPATTAEIVTLGHRLDRYSKHREGASFDRGYGYSIIYTHALHPCNIWLNDYRSDYGEGWTTASIRVDFAKVLTVSGGRSISISILFDDIKYENEFLLRRENPATGEQSEGSASGEFRIRRFLPDDDFERFYDDLHRFWELCAGTEPK